MINITKKGTTFRSLFETLCLMEQAVRRTTIEATIDSAKVVVNGKVLNYRFNTSSVLFWKFMVYRQKFFFYKQAKLFA